VLHNLDGADVDPERPQQARGILDGLLPPTGASDSQPDEYFGEDLVAVMDAMITQAINEVGKPVPRMTREAKIAVVERLDRQGATQMRKSVESIATRLGISRGTAYAYLDEARSR
jgi:predicted transcriptional regulator YheO